MDIINQSMLFLINQIYALVGSYGWSIVILTVLIRVLMWPMNTTQTKNMRKMQELQPKLKELQERHKDNPQKMQEVMMKFYAENKFNPLAGCLPLLIQLPIFIGLFGALNSPAFLLESVHENFFFVDKLYHTLRSHDGEPLNGDFAIKPGDKFATSKHATLVYSSGNQTETKIGDTHKVVQVTPTPLIPGEPMDIKMDLDQLGVAEHFEKLKQVDVVMINDATKELEKATFTKNPVPLRDDKGSPILNEKGEKQFVQAFTASLPTKEGKDQLNMDVLIMIVIYGVLTVLYQKTMTPSKPKTTPDSPQAEAQAKIMKMLPLMFVVMLLFIPIPAGVMIYLVITTALMFVQTALVNASTDKESLAKERPSEKVIEVKAD